MHMIASLSRLALPTIAVVLAALACGQASAGTVKPPSAPVALAFTTDKVTINVDGFSTVAGPGIECSAAKAGNPSVVKTCSVSFSRPITLPITRVYTATPAYQMVFAGWSGSCSGTNPVCAITGSGTATAHFVNAYLYGPWADWTIVGGGSGKVVTYPAGNPCGINCVAFLKGTVVHFVPVPDPDSVFAGWDPLWGFPCQGLTACTATMIWAASFYARFELASSR